VRDDIQVIVVDDNSDPDKVDFALFPGLNRPFTEIVFAKEGRGAGFARNRGLEKACGKYVLFADADDYFADAFLQHLDKHKDSAYDLIYYRVYRISKSGEGKSDVDVVYEKLMHDAIHKQQFDAYKYRAYVPWGKMISLSLLRENDITFDETIAANDKMFSIKTAFHAKNVHFDEGRIYTYVPDNGQITKLQTTEANFDRFHVYVRANRFLEDISKKKYRVNLIIPLMKFAASKDKEHFNRGLEVMRENNFTLFAELPGFFLSLAKKVLVKIKRKLR